MDRKERQKLVAENNANPKRATVGQLLKMIRYQCLECCGESPDEVERCTAGNGNLKYNQCSLYPYRFGINPDMSEKRRKSAVEKGKAFGFRQSPSREEAQKIAPDGRAKVKARVE